MAASDSLSSLITHGRAWAVYVGSTYREDLVFADQPQNAPIVHLKGPLTFLLADAPQKWGPGENAEFVVLFGTPGLGKGE